MEEQDRVAILHQFGRTYRAFMSAFEGRVADSQSRRGDEGEQGRDVSDRLGRADGEDLVGADRGNRAGDAVDPDRSHQPVEQVEAEQRHHPAH